MTNDKNRNSGFIGNLTDMLGALADLAEKGQQMKDSGQFESSDGRQGQYHVGFNIRTMANGQQSVQPFGNVRQGSAGEPVVDEWREPPVDVFEEDDHVLLIAEMPGVSEDNLSIEVQDNAVELSAEQGSKKFRKTVETDETYTADDMNISANNGVFEIRLNRAG